MKVSDRDFYVRVYYNVLSNPNLRRLILNKVTAGNYPITTANHYSTVRNSVKSAIANVPVRYGYLHRK